MTTIKKLGWEPGKKCLVNNRGFTYIGEENYGERVGGMQELFCDGEEVIVISQKNIEIVGEEVRDIRGGFGGYLLHHSTGRYDPFNKEYSRIMNLVREGNNEN